MDGPNTGSDAGADGCAVAHPDSVAVAAADAADLGTDARPNAGANASYEKTVASAYPTADIRAHAIAGANTAHFRSYACAELYPHTADAVPQRSADVRAVPGADSAALRNDRADSSTQRVAPRVWGGRGAGFAWAHGGRLARAHLLGAAAPGYRRRGALRDLPLEPLHKSAAEAPCTDADSHRVQGKEPSTAVRDHLRAPLQGAIQWTRYRDMSGRAVDF